MGMFEIRTITDADAEMFRTRVSRGFGHDADHDEASVQRFEEIFEYDRTLAVFDGDNLIGTGAGFSLGVTVPGGAELPMAGTTVITVQPTHRRRGVLRMVMERHLEDVAIRGEPLAGLWASESTIYGRFGYGPASFRQVAKLDARAIEMRDETLKGTLHLLSRDEAEDVMRPVYEAARSSRAGFLTRSDAWWTHRLLADPESWRQGKSKLRRVAFEEDGAVTGYATYRQKAKWDDFVAGGEVDVSEIIATTPDAHTALWSFLTNIDLFPNVEFWNMPLDDPLVWKVTDRRRMTLRTAEGLWIRVMDVPAALAGRRYDNDGVFTFDLHDPASSRTSGAYRLEVASGVGHCRPIDGQADLAFDADVLGTLYLGGADAMAMYAAGRITGDAGAALTLHRVFRSDQPPWCPEVF